MPLSALTVLAGAIMMLGSWFLIDQKLKRSPRGGSYQSRLLRKYFLYIGIYNLLMFFPYLILPIDPITFMSEMAVCYVAAHVFMYVSFSYLLRLLCSMLPKMNRLEAPATVMYCILAAIVTVLTAVTLPFENMPKYDPLTNMTQFHIHPAIGIFIGASGLLTTLPIALLMLRNGYHRASSRTRSFLLGIGLLLLSIGGPMHDLARTETISMIADTLAIIGVLVTATGVAYRIDQKISVAKAAAAAASQA